MIIKKEKVRAWCGRKIVEVATLEVLSKRRSHCGMFKTKIWKMEQLSIMTSSKQRGGWWRGWHQGTVLPWF